MMLLVADIKVSLIVCWRVGDVVAATSEAVVGHHCLRQVCYELIPQNAAACYCCQQGALPGNECELVTPAG